MHRHHGIRSCAVGGHLGGRSVVRKRRAFPSRGSDSIEGGPESNHRLPRRVRRAESWIDDLKVPDEALGCSNAWDPWHPRRPFGRPHSCSMEHSSREAALGRSGPLHDQEAIGRHPVQQADQVFTRWRMMLRCWNPDESDLRHHLSERMPPCRLCQAQALGTPLGAAR